VRYFKNGSGKTILRTSDKGFFMVGPYFESKTISVIKTDEFGETTRK
jgi:hypothetical protein